MKGYNCMEIKINMNIYILLWFNWRYCIAKKTPFLASEEIFNAYYYELAGDVDLVYPTYATKIHELSKGNHFNSILDSEPFYFGSFISSEPFNRIEKDDLYWFESYKRDTETNEIYSVQNNNFVVIEHFNIPHYFSNKTDIPFMIKSTNFSSVKLTFKLLEKFSKESYPKGYKRLENEIHGTFVIALELYNIRETLFALSTYDNASIETLLIIETLIEDNTSENLKHLQQEIFRVLTQKGKLVVLGENGDYFAYQTLKKTNGFNIHSKRKVPGKNKTKVTIFKNNLSI